MRPLGVSETTSKGVSGGIMLEPLGERRTIARIAHIAGQLGPLGWLAQT